MKTSKLLEARENVSRLVLVWHLIGWTVGVATSKQTVSRLVLFWHLIDWKVMDQSWNILEKKSLQFLITFDTIENCSNKRPHRDLWVHCTYQVSIAISVHEDDCYICGDGGELLLCDKGGCSKCYHRDCLGGPVTTRGKWICPWHFCDDCGKWANVLCSECPNSYCRAHASGQITEVSNGVHVCCDHIVTRTKTIQDKASDIQDDSGEQEPESSTVVE